MNIHDKAREDLLNEVNGLTDDEINRKPAADQWSIKQILEHLYLMEGVVATSIQKQLSSDGARPAKDKPIELTVNRSTKIDAPPYLVPSETFATLRELKEKLAFTHKQLQTVADSSTEEQLEARSFPHPLFGNLNLKQWIPFIGYHEMRHIEQIKEVKTTINLMP